MMDEHQSQTPPKKNSSFLGTYFTWILAAFIVTIISIFMGSLKSNNQTKNGWTTQEKASLCKAYIADQFGKPLHIMRFQRVDNEGNVYVSYNRSADNTTWDYVCDISGSSMVWAGWIDGGWGRWRHEDKVNIHYNSQTKTASFDSIMSSDGVKVKL